MPRIGRADQGRQSPKLPDTRAGDQQSDPDEPRWSDRQVAVLVELSCGTGWHRRRHGLPEADRGLTFRERCRQRLAWLRTCSAGGDLWAGVDDDLDHVDRYRGLPPELRHLRRPRRGAA